MEQMIWVHKSLGIAFTDDQLLHPSIVETYQEHTVDEIRLVVNNTTGRTFMVRGMKPDGTKFTDFVAFQAVRLCSNSTRI